MEPTSVLLALGLGFAAVAVMPLHRFAQRDVRGVEVAPLETRRLIGVEGLH